MSLGAKHDKKKLETTQRNAVMIKIFFSESTIINIVLTVESARFKGDEPDTPLLSSVFFFRSTL